MLDQLDRQRALAAAGHAEGQQAKARRNLGVALRQRCVAVVALHDAGALFRAHLVVQAKQGDLGAHHGPVGLVVVEYSQALIVASVLQIGADKAAGQGVQAAIFQVHAHEGDVGHDVGPAEGVIELDAVEQGHLPVHQGDVIEIDVTMAFADQAGGLALINLGNQPLVGSIRPLLQGVELLQVSCIAQKRANLLEVLGYRGMDLLRCAERGIEAGMLNLAVEAGQHACQLVNMANGQAAIALQVAEQILLTELASLDQIFDSRAVATQNRRFGAAGNRDNVQVQLGRQAAVQADFFLAEMLALFQRGIVEKAEIDRFLDLVNIVAGQQHPGNMGFNQSKTAYRVVIQVRVLQRS